MASIEFLLCVNLIEKIKLEIVVHLILQGTLHEFLTVNVKN